MTLANLSLEALGARARKIMNTNTAEGLSKLTRVKKPLVQRKEIADVVYSTCLDGGVG